MVEKVEKSDSLPTEVKLLVRAIADDDSVGFANMVSYPLQRPYPLRDIDGADQMKSYYKELVDDSLRNVITQAEPKRWSKYGWRGWTLDDGRYIWVDEGVYDVQYLSQKEIKMIDSLIREEILSIEAGISVPTMTATETYIVWMVGRKKTKTRASIIVWLSMEQTATCADCPPNCLTGTRKTTDRQVQ